MPPPPCLALRLYLSEKILKWGFQHRLQSFTDPTLSGLPPTHDIIYIFFRVHKTWISVKLGSHVFRIWIICIWNKDTQRSQSLETTIAPKFKVQNRPKIAQKNRHNVTIFRMPSPKISTNQKIVPTDQNYQHVFATLLHILFTPPEEKIKRPWIWYMRRKFQKATTRPY